MRVALKDGDDMNAKFDTACAVTLMKGEVFDKYNVEKGLRLDPVPWVRFIAADGNEMTARGKFSAKLIIKSAVGENLVTVRCPIVVIDSLHIEVLFGAQEIVEEKVMSFIAKKLLVFMNAQPPMPIALIGAVEDPDVTLDRIYRDVKSMVNERRKRLEQPPLEFKPGLVCACFEVLSQITHALKDEEEKITRMLVEKYSWAF